MKKNPAEFALIIPFLGGPHLFAIYGDENPVSDISNVIYDAGLAAEDSLEILPIAPDKERIHTYMARGGNPKNGNRFRWALAELIMTNSDIARAFERATGGLNAPPRPCTDEYEGWEAVRAAIRKHRLKHAASMVVFEPVAGGRDAPWCQNCKGDDHLHWGCPPVKDGDNDDWWGNLPQASPRSRRGSWLSSGNTAATVQVVPPPEGAAAAQTGTPDETTRRGAADAKRCNHDTSGYDTAEYGYRYDTVAAYSTVSDYDYGLIFPLKMACRPTLEGSNQYQSTPISVADWSEGQGMDFRSVSGIPA
ncbi:hypothetical protein R3P38DRAFT_2812131 [Favolaschia claudopus]|uniref:Uncharacterized protein n=1 Tax=Favolaschia claudopus TaxID=2862362 RepID=A0AAV9Z860_9AGAR